MSDQPNPTAPGAPSRTKKGGRGLLVGGCLTLILGGVALGAVGLLVLVVVGLVGGVGALGAVAYLVGARSEPPDDYYAPPPPAISAPAPEVVAAADTTEAKAGAGASSSASGSASSGANTSGTATATTKSGDDPYDDGDEDWLEEKPAKTDRGKSDASDIGDDEELPDDEGLDILDDEPVGDSKTRPSKVTVEGNAEVVLISSGGKRYELPGQVPAGKYEIEAEFEGDDPVVVGKITVEAGTPATVSCNDKMGICRPK